jgi:hypothetical protein
MLILNACLERSEEMNQNAEKTGISVIISERSKSVRKQ